MARKDDLDAITEIYNEAIETTTATFDTERKTADEQLRWFEGRTARHPIYVAEIEGTVVGWASLSPWSGRCAYADTAETSFYVKAGYRGEGVGTALKRAVIDEARSLGFHVLIAQIAEGADTSRHINENFGFRHVGTLREVGRKFGRTLGCPFVSTDSGLDPVTIFAAVFGKRLGWILTASVCLVGCAQTDPQPADETSAVLTECVDPRPQLCTQDYRPVCGVRDTGVRCVTTPCDSTERVTYGNACTACSNPDVLGYSEGMCED